MKMFKIISLFLSGILLSANIFSQDSPQPDLSKAWSLQQCIEYAQLNNLQIKQPYQNQHKYQ